MEKIIEKTVETKVSLATCVDAEQEQEEQQQLTAVEDGLSIGPYQILETIGSGGMGIVYKVRHKGAGTILAMKVLKQELTADPINVKRFQQELKTASLINHPNVLPVFDSGVTDGGCPYLVMEYLDGYTLEEILQEEGFLDLERFIHIFTQVCDALCVAHEKRIIHRDLKPSNIMITTSDSDFELVKVLDFGIARVFQKAAKDGARLTQLGDVLGSPLYMSPEQCLSQKLDERSDIYALGVVMYEALTGTSPFPGENAVEIIMAHLQKRPAPMNVVRPDFNIPPELENLVFTCLEKEVSLRPERLQDVSAELQRLSQSLKSRRTFFNFRHMQKRLMFAAKREVRRVFEKRDVWLRPMVASIVTACVCVFALHRTQPVESVSDLAAKADGAIINQEPDDVAKYWDQVIALAQKQNFSDAALAHYHEKAADALVTVMYKQLGLNSSHSTWNFLSPDNGGDYTRSSERRAALAKPHLLKALALAPASERSRLLEKLTIACEAEKDLQSVKKYLLERLKSEPVNQQIIEHLAAAEANLGMYKEAEERYTRLWHMQEAENHQPYAPAMQHLAMVFHSQNKFDEEIKLRQEMIEEIRAISNRDYNYQLKEELTKLANVLRKVGRADEARVLTLEASKIKQN